ncbi:MAG: hypothetical protein P8X93_01975 [Gammaproteobacteria bacterium]|jgi:hypothetical protein
MPDTTNHSDNGLPSRTGRWLWFIGLYLAGLLATFLVVYFFRSLLGLG